MPDPSSNRAAPHPQSGGEWTGVLRSRLGSLSLSPTREREIVEELSQHLDQLYEELRRGGATHEDARQQATDELLGPEALAAYMGPLRQAHVAEPVEPGGRQPAAHGGLPDCQPFLLPDARSPHRRRPGVRSAGHARGRAGLHRQRGVRPHAPPRAVADWDAPGDSVRRGVAGPREGG